MTERRLCPHLEYWCKIMCWSQAGLLTGLWVSLWLAIRCRTKAVRHLAVAIWGAGSPARLFFIQRKRLPEIGTIENISALKENKNLKPLCCCWGARWPHDPVHGAHGSYLGHLYREAKNGHPGVWACIHWWGWIWPSYLNLLSLSLGTHWLG